MPNLKAIDLSNIHVLLGTAALALNDVFGNHPNLQKVAWNGSNMQMPLDGIQLRPASSSLTELYLDNSRLGTSKLLHVHAFYYMFMHFPRLQRLSIKNCTWGIWGSDDSNVVSDEMIIKMVREHSSLRWLKSDLTEENITRMKQERPDITFVSE